MSAKTEELLRRVAEGEPRALARVCRILDDLASAAGQKDTATQLGRELQQALYRATVAPKWVLGITGSPGAGKSTLVNALLSTLRKSGMRCCVIAVDPSSPFSGGAILGDRIRMQRHSSDPGVFIRSVATRGALGGLSRSCFDLQRACALWGADAVLIETVGVGQDEVDVIAAADTTCVVVAPGMGDDVQANKAGILEVADILVVNKADLPGARRTVSDLRGMLMLSQVNLAAPMPVSHNAHTSHSSSSAFLPHKQTEAWLVPLLECVSVKEQGIEELVKQLLAHRRWLNDTAGGQLRKASRRQSQAKRRLLDELLVQFVARYPNQLAELSQQLSDGLIEPLAAAERLLGLADKP